jgi:hypothetical protein
MTHGLEITGALATFLLVLPLAALAAIIYFTYFTVRARRTVPAAAQPATLERESAKQERAAPSARAAPVQDLRSALQRAETRADEAELVGLHYAVACREIEAGRLDDAASHLRASIRLASKNGNRQAHAQARLELAEIARASGDLTTACEHWQIARSLYFELRHAPELAKAEARMREHGCPTDWVLNDF